jgi:electron transport complex protein RnfG
VGVAAAAGEPGFQDVIRLIFGFDPGSGDVLGMKVLESKETPGLGDKIVKDSVFVAGFEEVAAPLVGVKAGQGTGGEDEVHMITGATISSQAVIDIINHRVAALEAPLRRLWESGLPAPRQGVVGAQDVSGSTSASPGGDR